MCQQNDRFSLKKLKWFLKCAEKFKITEKNKETCNFNYAWVHEHWNTKVEIIKK